MHVRYHKKKEHADICIPPRVVAFLRNTSAEQRLPLTTLFFCTSCMVIRATVHSSVIGLLIAILAMNKFIF